jgi:hypothetical protein
MINALNPDTTQPGYESFLCHLERLTFPHLESFLCGLPQTEGSFLLHKGIYLDFPWQDLSS